ncbi:MAG: cytochrome c3 family protein, partial [Pseudobdellovibrionaceae bacterium]
PAVRTKADWANGYFMHKQTLQSCSECHTSTRPATTSAGSPHPSTGDCLSCHSSSLSAVKDLASTSYSSFDLSMWQSATGVPTTTVWDVANDLIVAVKRPNYNANKILTSWATANQTLNMPMNHSVSLSGLNMSNCTSCHANTTSYTGGKFHSSLVTLGITQPTQCLTCHNSSQQNVVPSPLITNSSEAFVGPATGVNATTNPTLFNHATQAGLQNCSTCHQQSSWSAPTWQKGQFHRTNSIPTSCQECHAPGRPSGLVGVSSFDHSLNGTGDCAGCHTGAISALSTKTAFTTNTSNKLTVSDWAGAVNVPNGLIGTTTLSVAAVKLNTQTGAVTSKTASSQSLVLQFNHANFQTNCTTCHTTPGVFTGAKFHTTQSTQPTSCKTCHTGALETFVLGASVQKPLDHNHSTVKSQDCSKCHASPRSGTTNILFKDGLYHSKITAQPTTCKECHSPKILDQPVWGSMNHSTVGSTDCVSCHSFPGTGVLNSATNPPNWKGSGGAMPATVSLTPPTGRNWGNLTVPHPIMASNLTGISCATCHGNNVAARIIGYDHANPPSGIKCVYCHYSSQTVVGVSVDTKSHEGASNTKDCNASGCHNKSSMSGFSYPTWNSTSKSWTGGKWR